MSFLWRMDKQTIIHTHNVVLLNNKEEQIPDRCNSLDGSQMHYASYSESDFKGYLLCDSPVMAFSETKFRKQIYGCRCWDWGQGLVSRDTRELLEVMRLFSILIGVVIAQQECICPNS